MLSILVFFGSLLVLVTSADFLVKFATRLSASLRLSPLVIGATIVSLGTSLPELSVSISSIAQKVPSLSLGDIIGSNIVNIGLILAISIYFFPLRVGTEKTQRNNLILVLLTLAFIFLQFLPLGWRQVGSPFLLFFAFIFILLEILWGKRGSFREDFLTFLHLKKPEGSLFENISGLVVSLIFLIFSSRFLVVAATQIAEMLGVEKEVVGLSFVAVGTSLPELTTSIVAGIKREEKLLLGNILGSNILNLAFIGAFINMFVTDLNREHYLSLFYLVFFTLLLFFLLKYYQGKVIPKVFGLLSFFFYLTYLLVIYRF